MGRWPGVALKRMMGSFAMMSGPRMFAFPYDGGATVKLPMDAARRLVAAGHARPFVMKGRAMGGWFWMPGRTVAEKRRLAKAFRAAIAYVRVAPPPKARRKPLRRPSASPRA